MTRFCELRVHQERLIPKRIALAVVDNPRICQRASDQKIRSQPRGTTAPVDQIVVWLGHTDCRLFHGLAQRPDAHLRVERLSREDENVELLEQ